MSDISVIDKRISTTERHFIAMNLSDESKDRYFFCLRCKGRWLVEELDRKEIHGSKVLKKWGYLESGKDLKGYVSCLVVHTSKPLEVR